MGAIRITSGTLKGRTVRTPEGDSTRPLLTRLRKSLADILRPTLRGARVLDLFGGTGAVAFELLSNGAREAVIVELDPTTAELIRRNSDELAVCARVLHTDALRAVALFAASGERFDVIVVAPPYGEGLQQAALDVLGTHWILAPNGTLVVQRDCREPQARTGPPARLRCARTRRYGRTVFDFYREASP
jgi:16S rRNA (guanine966-N2)-methyltransferase